MQRGTGKQRAASQKLTASDPYLLPLKHMATVFVSVLNIYSQQTHALGKSLQTTTEGKLPGLRVGKCLEREPQTLSQKSHLCRPSA